MMPIPSQRIDRAAVLLLGLGLVARLLWLMIVHPEPMVDFAYYYNRAVEQSLGEGYNWMGHSTAYYPVGTSSLLAATFLLFGASVPTAQVVAFIAGLLTIGLTYLLAREFGRLRPALWAAALVAIEPDLIVSTGLVASENFYLPSLLAALLLMLRALRGTPRWPALALLGGMLFGVSLLVRSTGVILVPLLALIPVLQWSRQWRRGLLTAAGFLLGAALVVSPWIARNAQVMGAPVLSTNGGIALWWGNNLNASGGFPLSTTNPTQDLSSIQAELASNRYYSAQAKSFIVEHPRRWLALAAPKFVFLFGPVSSDLGYWTMHRHAGGPTSIDVNPVLEPVRAARLKDNELRALSPLEDKAIGAYYRLARYHVDLAMSVAFWVFGLAGLFLLARRREDAWRATLLLLSVVGWVVFHITLGNGQPRYLMPMMPLLVVGTAWCMTLLLDRAGFAEQPDTARAS